MHKDDAAAGLNELEGYLMSRAAHQAAAREAADFADALPWLGSAEREDLVRLYAARHLVRTRQTLHEVAGRSRELREEYSRRYQTLRCRMLALTLLGSALTLFIFTMILARPA
ncbi:hypothetical protein [Streptomyces subrutilus]|uniref:hypothetical protein n=1 Tax=Streptomyces subrutilus TaxID=36818 RepID=UPI0033E26406